MLRQQLVAAIGKEVSPSEFGYLYSMARKLPASIFVEILEKLSFFDIRFAK